METAAGAVSETNTGKSYVSVAGHEIALWQQGGQFYAFLPSACREMDLQPEIPEETAPDSIVWMYSENIPAVFIDTKSGSAEQIHADKNVKEAGEISVLEADGSISLRMPLAYIKSRGNTSFTSFEKKPYQIKLTDAVSLLGMDAAKKWIFISNAPDTTLLRNALSRKLAGQLDLAQSKDDVFVDLYLNGEYAGNYYVTEKVEVHKNRLPITDMEKMTELTNNNEEFNVYETAWTDTTKAKDVPKDPVDITGGYFCYRKDISPYLETVALQTLLQLAEMTAASAAMDRVRWSAQYAENSTWESREEEVAFLADYILERKAFLDKAWIEQTAIHEIELFIEDAPYDTLYVFSGEKMPKMPDAEISYAEFLGWTSEKDGQPPDLHIPVYEDMVFHAVLQYP